MAGKELIALAPIVDALPELRAADYGDVIQWDSEIVAAGAAFDAYTGQRLALIRDRLTTGALLGTGVWTRYLKARGLNEHTARARIAAAEGHAYVSGPSGHSTRAYADRLPDSSHSDTARRDVPDIAGRAAILLLRDDAGDLSVDDLVDALSDRAARRRCDLNEVLATLHGWAAVLHTAASPEYWADDDGADEDDDGQIVEADIATGSEWAAMQRGLGLEP